MSAVRDDAQHLLATVAAFPVLDPVTLDDALTQWAVSMGGRLALQSEITWAGLQDGYAEAGAVDPASPFAQLYWVLGPVKTQHCDDCLRYAAGGPYDRPGSGGNELEATPGDGHTSCGAACHCGLVYGMAGMGAPQISGFSGPAAPPPPPNMAWPDEPPPDVTAGFDDEAATLFDDYRDAVMAW